MLKDKFESIICKLVSTDIVAENCTELCKKVSIDFAEWLLDQPYTLGVESWYGGEEFKVTTQLSMDWLFNDFLKQYDKR
jgi:hypothetical protein